MLQIRATDGRRALGPQRERLSAAVVEDVHLFLDDVRDLADAAREQAGILEHRRLDASVSELVAQPGYGRANEVPGRLLVRLDILRAAWRLVSACVS